MMPEGIAGGGARAPRTRVCGARGACAAVSAAAVAATLLGGCELTEVTLAESEDVVVAETRLTLNLGSGDGATSLSVYAYLHRTLSVARADEVGGSHRAPVERVGRGRSSRTSGQRRRLPQGRPGRAERGCRFLLPGGRLPVPLRPQGARRTRGGPDRRRHHHRIQPDTRRLPLCRADPRRRALPSGSPTPTTDSSGPRRRAPGRIFPTAGSEDCPRPSPDATSRRPTRCT